MPFFSHIDVFKKEKKKKGNEIFFLEMFGESHFLVANNPNHGMGCFDIKTCDVLLAGYHRNKGSNLI